MWNQANLMGADLQAIDVGGEATEIGEFISQKIRSKTSFPRVHPAVSEGYCSAEYCKETPENRSSGTYLCAVCNSIKHPKCTGIVLIFFNMTIMYKNCYCDCDFVNKNLFL